MIDPKLWNSSVYIYIYIYIYIQYDQILLYLDTTILAALLTTSPIIYMYEHIS